MDSSAAFALVNFSLLRTPAAQHQSDLTPLAAQRPKVKNLFNLFDWLWFRSFCCQTFSIRRASHKLLPASLRSILGHSPGPPRVPNSDTPSALRGHEGAPVSAPIL